MWYYLIVLHSNEFKWKVIGIIILLQYQKTFPGVINYLKMKISKRTLEYSSKFQAKTYTQTCSFCLDIHIQKQYSEINILLLKYKKFLVIDIAKYPVLDLAIQRDQASPRTMYLQLKLSGI